MGVSQVLDVNHQGTNVSYWARRRRDRAGINRIRVKNKTKTHNARIFIAIVLEKKKVHNPLL